MDPVKIVYFVLPFVVVALVAAIYTFGYPLFIMLAVGAAFLGVFMMVGLTAIDVVKGMKSAKPEAAAAPRASTHAA